MCSEDALEAVMGSTVPLPWLLKLVTDMPLQLVLEFVLADACVTRRWCACVANREEARAALADWGEGREPVGEEGEDGEAMGD